MKKIPEHVKEFITRISVIYVATADRHGLPHMAAVQGLTLVDDERLSFTSWFCAKTVANVRESPHVALTVWDPAQNRGYQLLGSIEKVEDLAVLDGYVPDVEKGGKIPQVQRRLLMRVDRILDFRCGPHSDAAIHTHEGH
jgi:hypothetical protein